VAIVVGPGDEVLFIRRADRDGDPWSGNMAFPGGRAADTDASIRATAERETLEEIGLDLSAAEFLGALSCQQSPLREPTGALGVFPFAYRVDRWPGWTTSDEVAEVHRFGLGRLLAGEGRGTFPYHWRGNDLVLPCIRLDGTHTWGMTLRMLDEFLDRVRGAGP
jgi:8-oxo-dGTP pyrophosphatase MutT (NUDIX family)